jgi:hypothetical protein
MSHVTGLQLLLQKISKVSKFKIALAIPRIILPALAIPAILAIRLPNFTLPSVSSIGSKLANIGKGFLSALTPFQQKLQSLVSSGNLSNLSASAALSFIGNTLSSAANFIGNIATQVVNNAISNATASVDAIKHLVDGFGGALGSVNKSIILGFKSVSSQLSHQSKSVSDFIQKEIDLAKGQKTVVKETSQITTVIQKEISSQVTNLSNIQQKTLLENPDKKQQFIAAVTNNAITNGASKIATNLIVNGGYSGQIKVMAALNNLT